MPTYDLGKPDLDPPVVLEIIVQTLNEELLDHGPPELRKGWFEKSPPSGLKFVYDYSLHPGMQRRFKEQLDHFAEATLRKIERSQVFWFRARPDIKDMTDLTKFLNQQLPEHGTYLPDGIFVPGPSRTVDFKPAAKYVNNSGDLNRKLGRYLSDMQRLFLDE